MPGLTSGEVNGCNNPRIFFTHRTGGLLSDPYELRFSIYDLTGSTPVLKGTADTLVNLADCPTGSRVGLGRFAPPIDTSAAGLNLVKGTHEVRWKYKSASTDAYKKSRQRFEVLDADKFLEGDEFVGYVSSKQLQSWGFAQTVPELQDLINRTSRRVELITGRFFEPRFLDMRLSARSGRTITLGIPIIALESITVEVAGVDLSNLFTSVPIDNTLYQVFNRHLDGVTRPFDDRDDPKIQFIDVFSTNDATLPKPSYVFPKGIQNAHILGVFGYTDPDGSPAGETPVLLAKAVAMLVAQAAVSPISSVGGGSGGGLIKSAKTRDQSVTYFGPTEGGGANLTGTGNRELDDILIQLSAPAQLGAV